VSLSSGAIVGNYEIVAPLGAGGMGEVYRAFDPRLRREVAIKILPANTFSDAAAEYALQIPKGRLPRMKKGSFIGI